ncbi:hypothetical protein RB195_022424 [Necator americanus]|uniref:Glucuronosyltransferase n=1 Tax=Necator americanus TaxID=51031 RepID=A0ABR1EF85_NECAM
MATKLALPGMGHELCTMSGIGGHIEKFNSKNVQLKILTAFGDEVNLQIQTKPIITNGFPSVELTKEDKQKFHGLQFGVPEMPSLPPDRVVITKAFQNVGCDLIGPFESKMDEGMYRNLKSSIPVVAIDRDHDKDFDSNLIQSVSQAKEALEFSERISNRQPRHGKNMNLKIREIVLVEQEQPNQASKKRAYEVIQRFEQSLE